MSPSLPPLCCCCCTRPVSSAIREFVPLMVMAACVEATVDALGMSIDFPTIGSTKVTPAWSSIRASPSMDLDEAGCDILTGHVLP